MMSVVSEINFIVYNNVRCGCDLKEDPVTIPICTVRKAQTDYIQDFVPIYYCMCPRLSTRKVPKDAVKCESLVISR